MAQTDLPPLRDILKKYDLTPKKSLGQNFLLDPQLLRRIAQVAGDLEQSNVVEIGSGPGGLTRALLELKAKSVTAIERDDRCIHALEELKTFYPEKLHIIPEDALILRPQNCSQTPLKIVANLPYNIGTLLLLKWFQDLEGIESLTLLLQKEVVLRLVGKPRTKDYGRLSIIAQWLCHIKRVFDVAPSAFFPPPKVVSSVVHLIPKNLSKEEQALTPYLEKITKAAFAQRRKMLRTTVKEFFTEDDLLSLGIQPTQRAEELTLEQFSSMAQKLQQKEV